MHKRLARALLAAMTAASVVAEAQDAEGEIPAADLKGKTPQILSGAAIQSLVAGKTLVDKTKNSERSLKLASGGELNGSSNVFSGGKGFGKAGEGKGSWKLEGDKLCLDITWKTSEEKWCRPVWKVGGQHYIIIGSGDKQRARPVTIE